MADTALGLSADTSSYPKPQAPASPLDIAGKLGGLTNQAQQFQRGAIDIDQAKLKLYNDHFQLMNNELSTLANDPAITKDKVIGRLNSIADMLQMPGPVRQKMLGEFEPLKSKEDLQKHLDYTILRGQDTNSKINSIYGAPGGVNDGQNLTPSRQGLRGGPVPSGAPIALQAPPSTPGIMNSRNEPGLLGNVPAQIPPGTRPVRGGFPGQYEQAPSTFGPLGTATSSSAQLRSMPPAAAGMTAVGSPATYGSGQLTPVPNDNAVPPGTFGASGPQGPRTGVSPDYEPGLKQLTEDRAETARTLRAIKPAIQAFPLLKDLTTGIGTETVNKALAGLSNLGWLPQGITNKVEAYQIANKKMADYLRSSPLAQRSDAQTALSQSASPDPKGLINAALVKVLPDAVALDRARALASISFTDEKGNPRIDHNNYGHHAATFPPKIDERALKLDFMDKDARNKLIDEMEKKQNTPEGKKFKYTYGLAEKNGLFER